MLAAFPHAGAARLSQAEDARSLVAYSTGYATLATNSAALEGYPSAALVGYSLDAEGLPVFCFSAMSSQCAESGPPTTGGTADTGRLRRTAPGRGGSTPRTPVGRPGRLDRLSWCRLPPAARAKRSPVPWPSGTQVDPHQGPDGSGAHVHGGRQGGALRDREGLRGRRRWARHPDRRRQARQRQGGGGGWTTGPVQSQAPQRVPPARCKEPSWWRGSAPPWPQWGWLSWLPGCVTPPVRAAEAHPLGHAARPPERRLRCGGCGAAARETRVPALAPTQRRCRCARRFWADFGDFTYFRMHSLKAVNFVGGFARAGSITPEDYIGAMVDPIQAFAAPYPYPYPYPLP